MRSILLVVCLVCMPQFASAQSKKNSNVQEVNFEETSVDGEARTPDGAYMSQRKGVKFMPLFKVKKNFRQKIQESVDYLR